MKKTLFVLAVAAFLVACNCSVNKNCGGKKFAVSNGGDSCAIFLKPGESPAFEGRKPCKHGHKCGFKKESCGCEKCGCKCNPWKNVPCSCKAPVKPAPAAAPAPAPRPQPKQISSEELGTLAAVKSTSTGQKISFTTPIVFETNSDKLKTESYEPIKKISNVLKNYPNAHTTVEGYTDNTGEASYNLTLSEKRAKAVVEQLKANGVPAENLSYKGYGIQNPIADNKTSAGRAQNRRVELDIINK